MAMKPIVDGIEREQEGKIEIVRVNIQDANGRELAGQFGYYGTPTFIYFDAGGKELWRSVGSLDPFRVRQSIGEG